MPRVKLLQVLLVLDAAASPTHSPLSDSHQDHESTLHSLNMIKHFELEEAYFKQVIIAAEK